MRFHCMKERVFWLGWSQVPNVGPTRFAKLLSIFGTAENAWQAQEKELIPVLKPSLAAQFLNFRKEFSISEYAERMRKAKVGFLILNDPDYPGFLKGVKNAPFVLFYKGN